MVATYFFVFEPRAVGPFHQVVHGELSAQVELAVLAPDHRRYVVLDGRLHRHRADAEMGVVEVEIKGELNKVAKSLILSTIGLAPGVELSQENVQAAVRDLQGLSVFEDIQIWGERVAGGIKLIVVVEEHPARSSVNRLADAPRPPVVVRNDCPPLTLG